MGSRMMHYCISSIISDTLGLDDKQLFMLGGIAPDANKFMNVSKDVTHFVDRDIHGKGNINYMRFFDKYREYFDNPFCLGYFCHLVSDYVWGKDTYAKVVGSISREEKKEKLTVSYRDFWRLNGRIISRYSLKLHHHTMPTVQMTEISGDGLTALLDWIHKDFAYEEKTALEPLELFDDDNSQIIEYIEKSVSKSVEIVSDILADLRFRRKGWST